jgi:hypothetical protein
LFLSYPPQSSLILIRLWHPSTVVRLFRTALNWRSPDGGWHDVESWSGALDDGTQKMWWLAPDLFGKGPFRWLVYQGERGKLLATSDPFYLPDAEMEKLWVEVSLSK